MLQYNQYIAQQYNTSIYTLLYTHYIAHTHHIYGIGFLLPSTAVVMWLKELSLFIRDDLERFNILCKQANSFRCPRFNTSNDLTSSTITTSDLMQQSNTVLYIHPLQYMVRTQLYFQIKQYHHIHNANHIDRLKHCSSRV